MRHTEEYMKRVLKTDLQIPDSTNEKLKETYNKIRIENKKKTSTARKSWRRASIGVAAALAAVLVTSGTAAAAYLSAHTDFFQGVFGNSTRKSVEVRQVLADPDKDDEIMVDVPAKEYVPVDEEMADRLIGENVSDDEIVEQLGEHKLTIENFVSDGNAAVMYFTLEREGGVTALIADEELNHAKGATFSDESDFYFMVTDQNDIPLPNQVYIDTEKSTEDKYYLYEYMVYTDKGEGIRPKLQIETYPMTRGEMAAAEQAAMEDGKQDEPGAIWTNVEKRSVDIPFGKEIERRTIEKDGEWICSYSPISMEINMMPEAGYDETAASDPYCIKYIELKYKDGTNYILHEQDKLDNAGYTCGIGTVYRAAFNRIVDTDEISEIVINDHVYEISSL